MGGKTAVWAGVAVMALGAPAMASPEGVWEIEMRDSRYRVELCGQDQQALCGTLIWLGRGADNEKNWPYLNTMMIDHARPAGDNRWKGELHLYGQSASGTITQVSADEIKLTGCVALVFCKSYRLFRLEE